MTIAVFPGRFQPPHLGHILTLMKIYDSYDKIIIAVTNYTYDGRKPHVLPHSHVKQVLEAIFQHLPKIEVVLTDEGFPVRQAFDDLPNFDVVVTGNNKTIENMRVLGVRVEFVPRSYGVGYSGEELREKLNWNEIGKESKLAS